jgi:hypothetical protein
MKRRTVTASGRQDDGDADSDREPLLERAEGRGDSYDSEDEADESYDGEDNEDLVNELRESTDAITYEQEDETLVFVAGLAGFVLAMIAGIVILRLDTDLDKSYVMATGMVGLIVSTLFVSFCSKSKPGSLDDDAISPVFVFAITAGFGLMIGGLFGDLARRFPPGTRFLPGIF